MPERDLVHHQPLRRPAAASSARPVRAPTAPRRRRDDRRNAPSAGTRTAPPSRHRVVIGDRNRLVMRDQEPVQRSRQRRPGPHPGRGARPHQVDRRIAAEIVPPRVRRQRLLMRAPAEFGRLAALTHEAVDRPGVDELARLLRRTTPVCVSRSAIWITFTPELRDSAAQPARVAGTVRIDACIARDIQQRLLDEMRHQAGVGAMRQHRRRTRRQPRQRQRALAQRVVRPLRRRQRRIGVAAGPRLDAGVEIQRARAPGKADQGDRGHIDAEVQQEIAAPAAAASARRGNCSRVSGSTVNGDAVLGGDVLRRARRRR